MGFVMSPQAELTGLELRVADLESAVAFYREGLGFTAEVAEDRAVLTLGGARFRIDLLHTPGAALRPYPCPGLYHFALLLPDRASLGAICHRVLERRLPVEGMADHAVSEAVYLRDPEMNGIELYHDRPREAWPSRDGEVAMVSEPLAFDEILAEGGSAGPLDPATRLGHIHLHVRDLAATEAFYADTLGLRVTQRSYPGALFLAAGDYHHHVGTNTWAPDRPVPEDATGLVSYTWSVPGAEIEALGAAGQEAVLHDPGGIGVRIVAA